MERPHCHEVGSCADSNTVLLVPRLKAHRLVADLLLMNRQRCSITRERVKEEERLFISKKEIKRSQEKKSGLSSGRCASRDDQCASPKSAGDLQGSNRWGQLHTSIKIRIPQI